MIIVAWSGYPLTQIFQEDMLYPISSIFITAAFLRLLQSMKSLKLFLNFFNIDFVISKKPHYEVNPICFIQNSCTWYWSHYSWTKMRKTILKQLIKKIPSGYLATSHHTMIGRDVMHEMAHVYCQYLVRWKNQFINLSDLGPKFLSRRL